MLDYNQLPKISFIVIQTRKNNWFHSCIESIKNQYYPNFEIVVVENIEKKKSIGKCWNDGVDQATGEYCIFIGDDDEITPDYAMCLMINFFETKRRDATKKGITSFITAFDVEKNIKVEGKVYATGMWEKDWLKKNPFDEGLKKRVDATYYQNKGKVATIISWHFGYFYRQHDGMVSGRSLKKEHIEAIQKKQKK